MGILVTILCTAFLAILIAKIGSDISNNKPQ